MKSPFESKPADEINHGRAEEVGSESLNGKNGVTVETHALAEAKEVEKLHQLDPNLPDEAIDTLREAARRNSVEKAIEVEKTFLEDSPYESVRAAVRPSDGEEIANTVRAWVLGFIFVTISAAINMFLSMRSPAITIPTVVIMLLSYPVGCLWARVVPSRKFTTFGLTWSFNSGPFTIKEHAVVTLMANVTYGYAYSTDALLALAAKPLYNIDMGKCCQNLALLGNTEC